MLHFWLPKVKSRQKSKVNKSQKSKVICLSSILLYHPSIKHGEWLQKRVAPLQGMDNGASRMRTDVNHWCAKCKMDNGALRSTMMHCGQMCVGWIIDVIDNRWGILLFSWWWVPGVESSWCKVETGFGEQNSQQKSAVWRGTWSLVWACGLVGGRGEGTGRGTGTPHLAKRSKYFSALADVRLC